LITGPRVSLLITDSTLFLNATNSLNLAIIQN